MEGTTLHGCGTIAKAIARKQSRDLLSLRWMNTAPSPYIARFLALGFSSSAKADTMLLLPVVGELQIRESLLA